MVIATCNYDSRNPPLLRGRYVTIRRQNNAYERQILNFCEVEELSCRPGRWGYKLNNVEDCSRSCSGCYHAEETCGVLDGHCYTGYQDGFWGKLCKRCVCTGGALCDRFTGCPVNSESAVKFSYNLPMEPIISPKNILILLNSHFTHNIWFVCSLRTIHG